MVQEQHDMVHKRGSSPSLQIFLFYVRGSTGKEAETDLVRLSFSNLINIIYTIWRER